ncbi:class E sortase [Streptomyces sp. NPDC090025]|uniref:class E sortase n=1 Tax=Streptomyces sp. NPDC090025 TaxID=3365922 RepID=UPI00383789A0
MTTGSPWFRATNTPDEPGRESERGATSGQGPEPMAGPAAGSIPGPGPGPLPGPLPGPMPEYVTPPAPYEAETAVFEAIEAIPAYGAPEAPQQPQEPYQAPYEPSVHETETGTGTGTGTYESYPPYEPPAGPDPSTMALRAVEDGPAPAPVPPSGPGRAERRRAAKRKGGGGGGGVAGTAAVGAGGGVGAGTPPGRPLTRVEARRAARAAKDSLGVVLSRVVGELFISFGVVMLLFVTYQLWWTNVRAGQATDKAKQEIENSWQQDPGQAEGPGAFEPGKGFAIMYIPKLDVVVPVAEGISKTKVLDKGMVGHYGEGKLKTAMPADKQGNFAVAGHRNTHGEPFRYINQLKPGDPIVVETRDAYYTYEMASILPQTAPSNVSVIDPVPKGSGFTGPGRYLTLTTCTPEFTSTYRMIVWGKLVDERPRDKGKPKALVG